MAPASCRRMRRWPRPARSSSAGGQPRAGAGPHAAAVASSCRRRRQPSRLPRTVPSTFRAARSLPAGALEHAFQGEPCPATIRSQSSRRSSACSNGCMRGTPACATAQVATYIPELAKADPDWFGICLATTDGHVYEVGDTRQPFTIQSISKPFVYGLALEDRGAEAVLAQDRRRADRRRVQLDQPGARHRAPAQSDDQRRRDRRHVAGRRATRAEDRLARLLAMLSRSMPAVRSTSTTAVYESERTTGHRNRAIGHMLRNFDILTDDPEAALDLYFQQCSIARALPRPGVMAATLANGGVNPLHRRARGPPGGRGCDPERHDHLRHVRLRRRMDLPRRDAGQERRRRRHARRAARAARHRRLLAAARRARQQRARRRGVHATCRASSICTSCALPARRVPPCGRRLHREPCPLEAGAERARARRRWTVPAAAPTSTSSRAISSFAAIESVVQRIVEAAPETDVRRGRHRSGDGGGPVRQPVALRARRQPDRRRMQPGRCQRPAPVAPAACARGADRGPRRRGTFPDVPRPGSRARVVRERELLAASAFRRRGGTGGGARRPRRLPRARCRRAGAARADSRAARVSRRRRHRAPGRPGARGVPPGAR